MGLTLSEAVAHLESRRLVHRDIKPDNILLRVDGSAVLVDLGIARHLEDTSLTQSWLGQGPGTPAFAAPEQLRNEKAMIDWRTDQFSLGVTLSIAMLGMHPYSGTRDLELVVQRMGQRESPVPAFTEAVRAYGLGVVARMVAPWPIHRFTRPSELIAAWQATRSDA